MIKYEVTLYVSKEIDTEFFQWLEQHAAEMLKYNGFVSAKLYQQLECKDNNKVFVACYELETLEYLDDYLKNHAQAMREDGVRKFGDKFSATRRVLALEEELIANTSV
ncbi:DUF4286 family protein [Cysteiniphilum sp. JM-1]|uniref:DUF4286 family protein n=1 Tax=Cysteiniphilum sp. JM-1 TaxID=2610891 RepID=UPI0012469C39|nr:DUF4286 family protein [Cysteiniphilum sp. JM-1]